MTTCPVPAVNTDFRPTDDTTSEQIRSATYAEFLYGYGAAPHVDLGPPRQFSQLQPGVFQQRFERGRTIANVGDGPAAVELPTAHVDLEGRTLRVTVVAPRSAEVLLALPQGV